MSIELSLDRVRAAVQSCKVVAVLGAHTEQARPAYYVPASLHRAGVRIIPVNKLLARQDASVFGEKIRHSLTDIGEPVDILDVFRSAPSLMGHLDEILAMDPKPKVVWLQSGIVNDEFAAAIAAAGIGVVQDRCLMVDHRNM